MKSLYRKHVVRCAPILLAAALLHGPGGAANAQTAADDFKQNCVSCHTIGGGRMTGPDLKNVTTRKDRPWLVKFLADPKAMIESGDPYALQLRDAARGTIMPTFPGMTAQRADALLTMIEAESKLPQSRFKGVQISERPFTAADIAVGRELFTGARALKNGGPACMSCHTTNDIGAFGGGVLGPDLTAVLERYGGRRLLSTWLSAPATPTMGSVFGRQALDPDEILPLVAYFQSSMQRSPRDPSTVRLNFIILGLGGVIVVLGLFDVFWKKRFRAVRRPLVEAQRARVHLGGPK